MKAYIPLPQLIEPDPATFIASPIEYYVVTQIDLLELDQSAAHFIITSARMVPNDDPNTVYTVGYNEVLGRVPVYGTKTDCENSCKALNQSVKEKALATVQKLSKL